MKTFAKHIILILMLVLPLVSCVDEMLRAPGMEIPEGESEIEASLSFPAFTSALKSRTAGDAIKSIDSLWIVIYEKSEEGWVLEKDGKIKITPSAHNLETTISENKRPDGTEQAEEQSGRATFRLRHKNGEYKIYAVANFPLSKISDDAIRTPEMLKKLKFFWDAEDISNNAEMFGCFTNKGNATSPTDDGSVIVSPNRTMHAWVRRAASKVTVAYDGRSLADGITIYLMSVAIKDIPLTCTLGVDNTVSTRDSILDDGEVIRYYDGDTPMTDENALLDFSRFKLAVTKQTPTDTHAHDEDAPALFFFENMQGKGKDKAQNAAGPGNDNGNGSGIGFPNPKEDDITSGWKDNKPYGTYIEVQALYNSTNSERPGTGIIKYRFMLGKNITDDYNAERNYHYQLTMKFNKYANDVDWHIDYKQQVLEVSDPKIFNYQGKVFVRDKRYANGGHNFTDENVVTVTSFIKNGEGKLVDWKMEFRNDDKSPFTENGCPDWLDPVVSNGDYPYEKKITFKVKPEKIVVKDIDIDALLQGKTSQGSINAPFNLANPAQGCVDPKSATIMCTANCYIVDGPGYYMFPLVYGNAIHNGLPNTNSYEYNGEAGENKLAKFKNHLGNDITSPYIVDNAGCDPKSAFLVWQDENELVDFTVWNPNNGDIKLIPEAYGGKGGICFHVNKIKQGNAVIALGETESTLTGQKFLDNLPTALWSWHIWFTSFAGFEERDKNIIVTAHDTSRKFEMMPMNLGWCSAGEVIKYYPGRSCQIRISAGEKSDTINIEQKSHMAFPMGNNPYYQWGRKDPFGPAMTEERSIKIRYVSKDWTDNTNPPRLSPDDPSHDPTTPDVERLTTRQALPILIQRPFIFHNPPRKPGENGNRYASDNKTYANLWEGRPGKDPNAEILKTVYDPCPVGYQVPHYNAFSGFITSEEEPGISKTENDLVTQQWYDVWEKDIPDSHPKEGVFEFYTNPDKYQSIIFPQNGYRDWNAWAYAYKLPKIGYVWMAGNFNNDDNHYFNFEFSRGDENGNRYVRPKNTYFPCDAFPIRPCVNGKNHGMAEDAKN